MISRLDATMLFFLDESLVSMTSNSILALSGGVGGAKLSLGLLRILPPDCLTVIVNTADDFTHLGLRISPDIDTTVYTLADMVNPLTGWGRRDETWTFMAATTALGGETWFRLGDGDLAMHVERTRRLANGESLSQITADIARHLKIPASIIPMTDDIVATRVGTASGELAFQDYFVRRQCAPRVTSLRFSGVEGARLAPEAVAALRSSELAAVVICPSNPYLSVDPILTIPGMQDLLRDCPAPIVAVSPLVGGKAVKGPTAKIMTELDLAVSAVEIARHYAGIIDGLVVDVGDHHLAEQFDLPVLFTETLMSSLADRERLALEVIEFAKNLPTASATPIRISS